MKKIGVFLICALLLFTTNGCSKTTNSGEENVPLDTIEKDDASISCDAVLKTLKEGGVPISYSVVYDKETDPNAIRYGKDKERAYLKKANFADERIETDFDKSQPRSGTIEVFATAKEAADRATVLHESKEDSYSYRIISDNILIRLSKDYTKEQAQEIAGIVGGEIHSFNNNVVLREKFGDTINVCQGEWELENKQDRLIISGETVNFIYEYEIEGKSRRNVHTFFFNLDENNNLIIANKYGQPRYTFALGDDGNITVGYLLEEKGEARIYKKISDNTDVPADIVKPEIGMSESDVYNSTWGHPKKKNTTKTAYGIREQWVYDEGYIYFENGYVTSIQEK